MASVGSWEVQHGLAGLSDGPRPARVRLSSLVYTSRATVPLSESELHELLLAAQARNRAESLTGLLIYDHGRFFQWLEGPPESLGRVWQSIRRDRRHTDVEILGDVPTPVRFFGDWDMKLATRKPRTDGTLPDAIDTPPELIDSLYRRPEAAASLLATLSHAVPETKAGETPVLEERVAESSGQEPSILQSVIRADVVPELLRRHAGPPASASYRVDPRARELARWVIAADPQPAFDWIDSLHGQPASRAHRCATLFEPAARTLGDLWSSDDCSDAQVTLGLCRLQMAMRRLPCALQHEAVLRGPVHAVLAAPLPGEPHLLGTAIASDVFWQAGWDVSCEFPRSDDALIRCVQDQWFDVLFLSLSGSFTREHRKPRMAAAIRAARAAARNPALVVIVGGRLFFADAKACGEVGADAGCASSLDLLPAAQRALDSKALH